MKARKRRETLVDGLGLLAILLVLLDYLRPALLLLPTVTAGGHTPCHVTTAAWLDGHPLPATRLHGWFPGPYMGPPLLLYYFPLPFLLMSALAPLTGRLVAFKLGTALGVFLLPVFTYASFRLMRFGFPAPLLGAAAAFVFLFQEDNAIWGGTIASTLTGEFSYTYGIGLAVLFLGLVYRRYAEGRPPFGSGPRARSDRRALRAVRPALPVPGRRRRHRPGLPATGRSPPRGHGARAPRHRPRRPQLPRAALLDRLELQRARGEGAVAGLPRACGHLEGDGGRPAGGGGVQPDPRAGGLHPHVRDHSVLQRPVHPRGGLQPGQPPDPSGLLPHLGAVRQVPEPGPQPHLLALRSRARDPP